MQPREYRTDLVLRIVIGVFGGIVGLGLSGIVFVSDDILSASFSLGAFAMGLFLAALGAYFITVAVRPDVLIVDDTGLHLRKTFGRKYLPWSAVRLFRVESAGKGVQVRAILHTDKKVGLGQVHSTIGRPDAHQVAAELNQALREHTQPVPEHAQAPNNHGPALAGPTQSAQPPQDVVPPPVDLSYSRSKGRKNVGRGNPKMVFFICLVLLICSFGGLMLMATVVAGGANKSGYTQAHGLSRSGIVTGVTNNEGRVPSSDVGVRLAQPVDGQTTTTAHVAPVTSLKVGAAVRVLVDPQDPGYAEFPGERYIQSYVAQVGAAAMLVTIAFFAFAAAWWGRIWYRQRR